MGLFSKKGAPQPSARPEYIEVGQIVNTHGVRGEVKVQPWDVSPELLCGFKTFYMDARLSARRASACRATWCS